MTGDTIHNFKVMKKYTAIVDMYRPNPENPESGLLDSKIINATVVKKNGRFITFYIDGKYIRKEIKDNGFSEFVSYPITNGRVFIFAEWDGYLEKCGYM